MINYIYLFLIVFFSIYLNYGPQLFANKKEYIYLITSIISVIVLVFLFVKIADLKYSLITATIFGKIIPTIFLTFISFYIIQDKKPNLINWFGIIIILLGSIIVSIF
jgi:uncharacterized membrane protein